MYASLSVVDSDTCAKSYPTFPYPYTELCTSSVSKSVCFGDGGGPVICSGTARDGSTTNVLAGENSVISIELHTTEDGVLCAGIMSFIDGTGKCADGIPSGNTRVSCYSDAIYSYINGNGFSSTVHAF